MRRRSRWYTTALVCKYHGVLAATVARWCRLGWMRPAVKRPYKGRERWMIRAPWKLARR